MFKIIQTIHPLVFLIAATILEVSGDAIIRNSIYHSNGWLRILLFVAGGLLLFLYGLFLNLAPVEFGQVVGLYIATLFIVWQVVNYVAFHKVPSLPIVIGGILVISGGLIITFWKPQ